MIVKYRKNKAKAMVKACFPNSVVYVHGYDPFNRLKQYRIDNSVRGTSRSIHIVSYSKLKEIYNHSE